MEVESVGSAVKLQELVNAGFPVLGPSRSTWLSHRAKASKSISNRNQKELLRQITIKIELISTERTIRDPCSWMIMKTTRDLLLQEVVLQEVQVISELFMSLTPMRLMYADIFRLT